MRALAITAAALALTVSAVTTTPAPAPLPVVAEAALSGPQRLAALTASATGDPLTLDDPISAPGGTVPVREQLDRWLEVIGYADEHRAGSLLIAVAPKIRSAVAASGYAAGIYHSGADGILLTPEALATPWVLAHEIGHWMQWRHPDREAIIATEVNADAIATVLLAGTEYEPDSTLLTPAQLELALEVMQGQELYSTDPVAIRPTQYLRYEESYAPDRAQFGVRYVTRAEIRQARARLDGTWAALPLAGTELTVAQARALAFEPWELEKAWARLGIEVLRVPDLLADHGYLGVTFPVERVVVIDDAAAGGFEGITELLARDAGLGRCWEAALDLAAWRSFSGEGTWAPVAADRCTVQGLMAAARVWQGSPWGSGAHVAVPVDGSLAARADFEAALDAAGLLVDPLMPGVFYP